MDKSRVEHVADWDEISELLREFSSGNEEAVEDIRRMYLDLGRVNKRNTQKYLQLYATESGYSGEDIHKRPSWVMQERRRHIVLLNSLR